MYLLMDRSCIDCRFPIDKEEVVLAVCIQSSKKSIQWKSFELVAYW